MPHTAMRSVCVLVVGSVLAGCATGQPRTARPGCDPRSNCFYQNSVRSFEILDDRTMLVEVGSARCPYLVEVDGFFCDLGMSSVISFHDADGRICSLDNSYISGAPFLTRGEDLCRIRNVRAINDDVLLESYVNAGRVPPPPPTGSGELEVEDIGDETQTEEPSVSPPAGAGP